MTLAYLQGLCALIDFGRSAKRAAISQPLCSLFEVQLVSKGPGGHSHFCREIIKISKKIGCGLKALQLIMVVGVELAALPAVVDDPPPSHLPITS